MIKRPLRTRILAAAPALAVVALGGCPAEISDPTATANGLADLTEFIAEFLRSALAAWAL
jgi:hypothetical protein